MYTLYWGSIVLSSLLEKTLYSLPSHSSTDIYKVLSFIFYFLRTRTAFLQIRLIISVICFVTQMILWSILEWWQKQLATE